MKRFTLALIISFISSLPYGATWAVEELDRIVAVVNEDVIALTGLQAEARLIAEELRRRQVAMPAPEVLLRQVLERMIMEKLQVQLAERSGIKVDDNTLNRTLRQTAARNNLSLTGLRDEIEAGGQSFALFREELRKQIQIKQLHQRFVDNKITITEQEIDNFLANQERQGNVRKEYQLQHILISLPEAATPELIAEKKAHAESILAQIRSGADFAQTAMAYSNSRLALEGGDLGWRSSGELPAMFSELAIQMKEGDVSEVLHNISGFHIIRLAGKRDGEKSIIKQTHCRHILLKTSELVSDSEAEQRLIQLKERIEAGEDFVELAKAHSEDSASARLGGDLGWVSPGEMVPEFEEVMSDLPPSKISEPFRSQYGWHILQILERREHDNTEQARRSKASLLLRRAKVEEELQSWLRQLQDEAYIENRLNENP